MAMKLRALIALALLALLALSPVEAAFHGSSGTNDGRVTINVPPGYLNLIKQNFAFTPDPANSDANGYPITTPTTSIGSNPDMPAGYFGEYVWKWSGTGSMQIIASPPMLISANSSSSGQAIFGFSGTGDYAGGNTFVTGASNTGVTAPRVQFLFGVNIQGISNNGSGLIRVATLSGFTANMTTGMVGTGRNRPRHFSKRATNELTPGNSARGLFLEKPK